MSADSRKRHGRPTFPGAQRERHEAQLHPDPRPLCRPPPISQGPVVTDHVDSVVPVGLEERSMHTAHVRGSSGRQTVWPRTPVTVRCAQGTGRPGGDQGAGAAQTQGAAGVKNECRLLTDASLHRNRCETEQLPSKQSPESIGGVSSQFTWFSLYRRRKLWHLLQFSV